MLWILSWEVIEKFSLRSHNKIKQTNKKGSLFLYFQIYIHFLLRVVHILDSNGLNNFTITFLYLNAEDWRIGQLVASAPFSNPSVLSSISPDRLSPQYRVPALEKIGHRMMNWLIRVENRSQCHFHRQDSTAMPSMFLRPILILGQPCSRIKEQGEEALFYDFTPVRN